jgi:hypothetical protein
MLQGEKNVQPDWDLNLGPFEYRFAALQTELFARFHIFLLNSEQF